MQFVLAFQIPWLNLHQWALHYQFELLGAVYLRFGDAAAPLELMVGSGLELSPNTHDDAYFAMNAVAAVLLAYLGWSEHVARRSRPGSA
jgi:hypothetical protein